MKRSVSVVVMAGLLAGLTGLGLAQQTPAPGSKEYAPGSKGHMAAKTIDCPPAAAAAPSGQVTGTPKGSGLTAMPSTGQSQHVEGAIKAISSTRTNRVIEVGDVKLEVEPDTVILVGCRPASMAQLKQGTNIKAAYEVKDPNRNVASVIEAQK
jgi:hypothetical protein